MGGGEFFAGRSLRIGAGHALGVGDAVGLEGDCFREGHWRAKRLEFNVPGLLCAACFLGLKREAAFLEASLVEDEVVVADGG